jgi:hypothetical protein
MSRKIDWEQPLSDKDREWAAQFQQHHALIEMNDAQFPKNAPAESLAGEEDEDVPPYTEWSKKDLVAEIDKRKLPMPGGKPTVADLATILEADDSAAEAAEAGKVSPPA